ncbi:permease [Actinotalea sp. M2MS4P-6]|uniref:permease n=1 Tax=Actinotalea sp. M2MS4P-6 TaxID=2983762 RepID=UPI0021E400D4|nr:permease [Actinotalea sp. M2MS4P-6]MCV2395672.1 permease [Actinotalea sp. M2MS4P-6]
MSVTERVAAHPGLRRWSWVVGAAVVWVAAYWANPYLWDWLLFDVLALDPDSRLGSGVHFFFYDTVKIGLLLTGIIFAVTVLRSFMSVERTRTILGGKREGVGNVVAAGLGVVTPFCSCSAVPAFIGFVAAGVPIGVTMSFLIASPMVNEVAIALLLGLFGLGPTLLYIGAGLTVAIVGGMVLGRLHAERWVEPFVFETRLRGKVIDPAIGLTWDDRLQMGREEVVTILRKIWPYLLVGIGLGAVIHGWAPEDLFARYAGAGNPLAVPVAVLIGVPLYSNAAGVLPLVEALHDKGLPMGTLLAFMMAVVALSLPEMILLRRVLKPRLIATFIGVVAAGILAVGYLFNAVLA